MTASKRSKSGTPFKLPAYTNPQFVVQDKDKQAFQRTQVNRERSPNSGPLPEGAQTSQPKELIWTDYVVELPPIKNSKPSFRFDLSSQDDIDSQIYEN